MKKLTKKIIVAIVAIMAVVCISVSLTACGGATVKRSGFYSGEKKYVQFVNMQPKYNLFTLTLHTETIETFEDNTYCLTVNSVSISNVRFGPEYKSFNVGNTFATNEELKAELEAAQANYEEATYNDKDDITTKYYGTFEVVRESEAGKTIKLLVPTAVFQAKKGSAFYDTDNWTEAMAGDDNTTAADFLAGKVTKFNTAGIEVYLTLATSGFDIITEIL